MLISVRSIAASAAVLAAVIAAACGGGAQQVSPLGPSAVTANKASALVEDVDASPYHDARAEEPDPLLAAPGSELGPGPAPESPAASPEFGADPAPVPGPEPDPGAVAPPSFAPEPGIAPPASPIDPNKPVAGPQTFSRLVTVRVDPDPVPYSGRRIEIFSCRDLAHTWFYTQLLNTTSGIGVTFTERENFFDGVHVSTSRETHVLEGNSGLRIESRWCSAFPIAHTAQHRLKGKDANGDVVILTGPVIHLLADPTAPPPATAPR